MKTKIIICIFACFSCLAFSSKKENNANFYLDKLARSYDEEAIIWLGLNKDPRAIPLICKYLEQERAILSLGHLGSAEAIIPLLRRILKNPYDFEIVIETLQKIDPAWAKRPEVKRMSMEFVNKFKFFQKNKYGIRRDKLLRTLFQMDAGNSIQLCMEIIKNPETYKEEYFFDTAITYLAENKIKQAQYPIMQIMEKSLGSGDYFYWGFYVKALDKINPAWKKSDQALKFITVLLKNPDKDIDSFMDLAKNKVIAPAQALPFLKSIIFNKKSEIRIRAYYAIEKITGLLPDNELTWLIPLFKDINPLLRWTCINHLGSRRIKSALPGIILAALEDHDSSVRKKAIEILGNYNVPEAANILISLANDPANKEHSFSIIRGLAKISPNPYVSKIIEISKKWSPKFSSGFDIVFDLLLMFDHPVAIKYFLTHFCQFYEYQRVEIIIAMVKQNNKKLLPFLQPLLKDPDPYLRAYAEWGIFKLSQ